MEATYRGVLSRRGTPGRGPGQQPPAWLRARSCKKKVRQAVERTLIEQAVRRVPAEGDGQKPNCKHLDGQSRQQ